MVSVCIVNGRRIWNLTRTNSESHQIKHTWRQIFKNSSRVITITANDERTRKKRSQPWPKNTRPWVYESIENAIWCMCLHRVAERWAFIYLLRTEPWLVRKVSMMRRRAVVHISPLFGTQADTLTDTHIQYLNINYNLETSTHIRSPAYTTFTEYAMQLWACSPISIRIKCVVILRAQSCSVQSTQYEFRFTPNGHKTQIHRRPHTEHCNFSDTWNKLVETYRAKKPVAIWGFQ